MSELWCSASPNFSSFLLYFSYFIFFYPYLLKLISFLSPLFITTSLLLFTFVFSPQFSRHSICNFVFLAYQSYSTEETAKDHEEEEEELEAFRVIFGASDFYDLIALPHDEDEERVVEVVTEDTNVKPAFEKQDMLKLESSFTKELGKLVVEKVQDIRETETETCPPPISKVKAISQRFEANLGGGGGGGGGGGEFSPSSRTLSNLGSCGSIRRDKEWKRTLACKLFEERHNNSAQGNDVGRKGEGMDLLWETYETKYSKASSKKNTRCPNVKEEEDDDDEEDGGGELCCLQALKFSGGKMNLGMKKPSLVKISKAIKGIRWLHHLTGSKGKKGTPIKA